jgi:hypothetical protein
MPRGRLAQPDSESFRIPLSTGSPRPVLSESGKQPIAGAEIRPLAPQDLGRWYSVSASKMSVWAGVYKQLGLTAHCSSTRYTMKPFLREMACLQWPEEEIMAKSHRLETNQPSPLRDIVHRMPFLDSTLDFQSQPF